MAKRVLAIVRASTERQEIVSQHNDMVAFASKKGFKENEIEWIEVKGASARKLNKKYLQMIEDIKNTITNNPTLNTVIAFHLNRLGRVASKLTEMMEWFTEHKIQVLIENPSITLLNDDLTRNAAAEITWSIFATMVKFDTDEMFDKYTRGKKHNASIGKFNGGQKVRYGYKLDANNYYIIDKESAEQIVMIYEMYASRKYSYYTLIAELESRGIKRTDGISYRLEFLRDMLSNECYCGVANKKFLNRVYPQIISKELFEKCKQVRKENNTSQVRHSKKVHLGAMIWKCNNCGYYLTSSCGFYHCSHHYNKYAYSDIENRCSMTRTFCEKYVDLMLWEVAFHKHLDFLLQDSDLSKKETEEQIQILKEKINALNEKINGIDARKKALSDLYLDGTYTKEEFNIRRIKLETSIKDNKDLLVKYNEDIERLNNILNTPKENYKMFYKNILNTIDQPTKEKQDIIRKYVDYGELLNNNDNSVTIKIHLYDGTVEQYIYRNKYKNQKLFNMDMTPYYTITDNLCEKGLIKVRKGEKFLQGILETHFI